MTIDEMIDVLQAAKEGKTILDGEGRIANIEQQCALQNYRVKPEPMEVTLWVSTNGRILQEEDEPVLTSRWAKKKFREVIE